MAREKYTFAQKTCIAGAGRLLQRVGALWPGCRVGIAISGGVDSFVLAKVMKIRQGITPFHFELLAVHLNAGFAPGDHAPLVTWLESEGLPGHLETGIFGPRAHSSENRKNSPCFLCAKERRKRLFSLCRAYNLTHLALGHNADDLLSTFLLNFMRNGRVQGMSACEDFFEGKLRLVRPLLFIEKKYIRQAARQWKLPIWPNACPSSGTTARGEMEALTEKFAGWLPQSRKSMLGALSRWQFENDVRHIDDAAGPC